MEAIMIAIAVIWGFMAGWFTRAMQQLMVPPRGSYGRPRHPGSDNSGPTTPKPPIKPQPSGGRMIREDQWNPDWEHLNSPGYHFRPSHRGFPNPPPQLP